MDDEQGKNKIALYRVGDVVQVTSGEMKNFVGSITYLNDVTKIAKLKPLIQHSTLSSHSDMSLDISVETELLTKYIRAGEHVKVIRGIHSGQTGRVVSVNYVDGNHIAAIITDGMNVEIPCNISNLQVSNGLGE